MTPERQIWAAANLLIQQHGGGAAAEAARLRGHLVGVDTLGVAFWVEVERAIAALQTDGLRQ